MSTLAEHPPEITMAADDFQALEERVLRTVELLKGERELRYSVEQHAARLTHRVEEQAAQVAQLEEQLSGLQKEREAVRQRIADQDHARAACRIGFFEVAAANDGDMHGVQIAGADEAHVNFGLIGHGQHGPALDGKWLVRAATVERERVDCASFFHAGQGFYALQNVVEEIYFSAGSRESAMRDGDAHCEHIAGVEAGAHFAKLPECTNHQASADEKHERQRDFADDQKIAGFAAGFGSAARALLEGFVDVDAGEAQRWKLRRGALIPCRTRGFAA